ncbi:50S ribosomal protein L25/general stress protein Ctc [Sphingorhabdus lutea]|uniref:Large ribosomal subunit protein bL25 n=1 Tax=Sphingorhabdus lutea TaxID=1913578 RepID=A0A1L3J924_9SPHN|nr:50S ribosomal protein L25/general stress protein Ctc [Sphingorhabdus lutea]APG61618.1 50S ribosomal protein L25/general stress protein Ctc [Sphingorhabdus lutea]
MSDQLTLSAELRERAGKGASRALRNEGRVPAVIYGDKKEAVAIHVEEKALVKLLMTGQFTNSTVELTVNGKTEITLPKDVAFHPVTDRPLHVDFFRLAKGATVNVEIPVHFINEEEAPGLKRGGVLNIVRHEVELICDATKIPEFIELDLTGFDIGDSIHISEVKLPKGTQNAITDRDFTVATIVAPSALKSEGEDEGEAEVVEAAPAAEGDKAED